MKFKVITITICCFLSVHLALGQTDKDPWNFGVGINAVDYKTHVPSKINIHYSALRFSVGRHLYKNFSSELSGSLNKIDNFSNGTSLGLDHSAVDFSVSYNFAKLLYQRRFNTNQIHPKLGVGAGYTSLETLDEETSSTITLNFLFTAEYNLNNLLSLYAQGTYKQANDEWIDNYIEYSLGIKYHFKSGK